MSDSQEDLRTSIAVLRLSIKNLESSISKVEGSNSKLTEIVNHLSQIVAVQGNIIEFQQKQQTSHADQNHEFEERIMKLEKHRWLLIGFTAAITFLFGNLKSIIGLLTGGVH